jgi:hypothetical protein
MEIILFRKLFVSTSSVGCRLGPSNVDFLKEIAIFKIFHKDAQDEELPQISKKNLNSEVLTFSTIFSFTFDFPNFHNLQF